MLFIWERWKQQRAQELAHKYLYTGHIVLPLPTSLPLPTHTFRAVTYQEVVLFILTPDESQL